MLRTQIVSFLRHDTSIFISACFNNLHTSQISAGKGKAKKNKSCEPISVAVVSIILRYTLSITCSSYSRQKCNSKMFAQSLWKQFVRKYSLKLLLHTFILFNEFA